MPKSNTAEMKFTSGEIDALKMLLQYALHYEAVRSPYSAEVESVLTKLDLLQGDTPKRKDPDAAYQRAPVKMQ